jgi:hypothetical protein
MRGPDFDLGRVAGWQVDRDGTGRLALADATHWSIASSAPLFDSVRTTVELAQRLDASGDRRTGHLDRVALPERLIPAHVANEPVDGKLLVVFHGPPTPAYLRTDRPWFAFWRA